MARREIVLNEKRVELGKIIDKSVDFFNVIAWTLIFFLTIIILIYVPSDISKEKIFELSSIMAIFILLINLLDVYKSKWEKHGNRN